MKELLSREGVPFTAYNVDEDDRAYDELIARGWRTVPVTIIGERTIKGFDADALMGAIADWRVRFEDPSQS
ncbi:MAG: glutaredoxin family protein [Acidobacteria bacterium]|nr:glutaredoxin family protein [Acidobacteriota bacterium]